MAWGRLLVPRITIAFGDRLVYLLLGDADAEERLVPSSDNIAVLFSPALLPDWAATIDAQIRAIGTGHPSRRCVSCPTIAALGELVSDEIRISSDTLDE